MGKSPTTHWTIVFNAGRRSSPGKSRKALGDLWEMYWEPLYNYLRRAGRKRDEAEDLIQDFFVWLMEENSLRAAAPQRGRFRNFLLTQMKHYTINVWRKSKRRGGCQTVSLDFDLAESRYSRERADKLSPEQLYEKRWALELLDRGVRLLRDEAVKKGKEKRFNVLRKFISGVPPDTSYAEAARELESSEVAVRKATERLRKQYSRLLRGEIAKEVGRMEEVEDEIRYLLGILDT